MSAEGTGEVVIQVPGVGDLAPEFALPDAEGVVRRLSDMVRTGPLILLFYRGHW